MASAVDGRAASQNLAQLTFGAPPGGRKLVETHVLSCRTRCWIRSSSADLHMVVEDNTANIAKNSRVDPTSSQED